MATEYAEIEVYIQVDEDGDIGIGRDPEAAVENYDSDVGGNAALGRRMVRVTLRVPLPKPIEVSGEVTVSEEPGELKAV